MIWLQCDAAVKEELAADEPSVIISRRPCALLKYVKHKTPLMVDADKCRSCKMCMKIGCPAISMTSGKAAIDNTLCTGCGVCAQLCKFDALHAPRRTEHGDEKHHDRRRGRAGKPAGQQAAGPACC